MIVLRSIYNNSRGQARSQFRRIDQLNNNFRCLASIRWFPSSFLFFFIALSIHPPSPPPPFVSLTIMISSIQLVEQWRDSGVRVGGGGGGEEKVRLILNNERILNSTPNNVGSGSRCLRRVANHSLPRDNRRAGRCNFQRPFRSEPAGTLTGFNQLKTFRNAGYYVLHLAAFWSPPPDISLLLVAPFKSGNRPGNGFP